MHSTIGTSNGLTGKIAKLAYYKPEFPSKIILPIESQIKEVHSCPKLKLQLVLSLSYFLHNSSINEHKNMKLRENICFEIIN